MKVILEIPDELLENAAALARKQRISLEGLMQHGLILAIGQRRFRVGFKLRDASVGGNGLHPDITPGSWDQKRALIYLD